LPTSPKYLVKGVRLTLTDAVVFMTTAFVIKTPASVSLTRVSVIHDGCPRRAGGWSRNADACVWHA
jgi:hypothetical protein